MKVLVPLRTVSGANAREHHMARHRRVKRERQAVAWLLKNQQMPPVPCVVRMVRLAPSNGLDGDNLQSSLKGTRDEVAKHLGVDDRDPRVVWSYAQERSKEWGVVIEIQPAAEVTQWQAN